MNLKMISNKILIIFLLLFSTQVLTQENNLKVTQIHRIDINSSINPSTASYISSAFEMAQKEGSSLVLINLNTPGGLVSTTKDILTTIGQNKMPTVVWIGPSGASATSAGAILASGAHLLFMSKGTNIGAATPITMSGDLENGDLKNKAINDLVALVESLSISRGHNSTEFGKMIKEAKSFSSQEAVEKNIADGLVDNLPHLLKQMHGKQIDLNGETVTLVVDNPQIVTHSMDLGQKILNIFSNPSLTYILFIIGAALIYLEFQAPGGYIAGGLGMISLIMSGIGFQILPLNFGALGLIVLAFILFILEAYITSFGLITISGIVSLTMGSLFLFRTDDLYLTISTPVIWSVILAISLFVALISFLITKDFIKKNRTRFSMIDKLATITAVKGKKEQNFCYQVKVDGEIWNAISKEELQVGAEVIVTKENSKKIQLEIKSNVIGGN